jgi:4-cresol dehydrogenase (hydroxylating)
MEIAHYVQAVLTPSVGIWIEPEQASIDYGATTQGPNEQFQGAVVVKSSNIIPSLLKLANTHAFHLHPVSSNNNWGYGSILCEKTTRPVILLDLSQLKGIQPTSEALGLITIEPGVTQQELYDYLQKHDWPYMVPVTGAGPSCSILSNALERGYGITPNTDHFYACTALKAYLPHPELCEQQYQSAVSALDNSGEDFIDKTFKWGLGPYIDGLFTQSNMGIVTEMTIRLARKPNYFSAFYIQIFDVNEFENAVNFTKTLLQEQAGLVGSINLMDRPRLISMTCDNPNKNSAQTQVLSEQQITSLSKEKHLPQWMIVGSIYGEKKVVNAVKSYIKSKGKRLGRIIFSDSLLLKMANRLTHLPLNFIPLFNDLTKQLTSLNEGIEIMLGKPNQVALPLPYWRNTKINADKTLPLHPAKDNCGLLWYAPLIKMDAVTLDKFVNFVRTTMTSFNMEPLITFTNLRHDCIDSTVPIVFNLDSEEETAQAHACLNALINQGREYGFVPYRLPIQQQQTLDKTSPFWRSVGAIKESLDPNNVLSPGKYDHS